MPALPVLIREILSLDDPALDAVAGLYERSFPTVERVPFDALVEHFGRSRPTTYDRHLMVAELEGQPIGMSSVLFLPSVECGFVMYVAVEEAHRRAGVGSQLMEQATERSRTDGASHGLLLKGLIMEVERPEDSAGLAERRIREDRMRFFTKKGARVLTDTYRQPPAWVGAPEVPLNLIYLPCDETWPDRKAISDFYRTVFAYGPDQPAVQDAMNGYRLGKS